MKQDIADMVAELKKMILEVSEGTRVIHVGYDGREQEVRESLR
ncbi:hypothetical protein T261_7035 [Streptomyces lydicus]|nr:hypothetical protein T261_7035 [Streptomyces lydicus]